jgi:nucleoside-diphosphate-sugar epimerase
MLNVVTGKSGTIGQYFPTNTYSFESDLTSDFSEELKFIGKSDFTLTHCAGLVGNSSVMKNFNYSYLVNVISTIELAKLSLSMGVKKFIFVSSSHVYESSKSIIDEGGKISPLNEYAHQKREAEVKLLEIFKDYPQHLLIARVFSLLDWGMKPATLGGAVEKLLKGEISDIHNGEDQRDFLTPRSTATILYLLTNSEASGILNVCSSKATKIKDAVAYMFKQRNRLDLITRVHGGNSGTPLIVGDNLELKKHLDQYDLTWKPKLNL